MDLKIVSKGHESIVVGLSNLSSNLKVNSEIYLLKEDKEILLGFVSHSLLVYFCVEFADYAFKNYEKHKTSTTEDCICLIRTWLKDPSSVSSEVIKNTAHSTASTYSTDYAANAVAYAAYSTNVSYVPWSSKASFQAAAGKNREKELQRQGEFIINYLFSNAWLFNL
jgi:hypothetical protein